MVMGVMIQVERVRNEVVKTVVDWGCAATNSQKWEVELESRTVRERPVRFQSKVASQPLAYLHKCRTGSDWLQHVALTGSRHIIYPDI